MHIRSLMRLLALAVGCFLFSHPVQAEPFAGGASKSALVFKVQSPNERLDMTVNSSRILMMDQKIPQAQVNNPDLMDVTPLSPNQIQLSAKKPGVTQVNLWGEDKKLYTVDIIIFADTRELELVLQSAFPTSALKVTPVANAVMISGYVDHPEHVERIIRVAEEFYPKVINNMSVGGVQQVLLHIKIMEVSRTKLRQLGFDFANVSNSGAISSSGAGTLINTIDSTSTAMPIIVQGSTGTMAFGVYNGSSNFLAVINALRRDNLTKIMSEPTLVTVSGRAASFNAGGEIPVPEPQSLGTISISWKKYGTQLEFVPIVLGNARIRLEVRPRVSALDEANSITINGTTVPGIKSRDADTAVELTAGETLAIAGLVEVRSESQNHGIPWLSEVPYVGAAFRSVSETKNEVELLILVTPELVEGMDASETPRCGPGMQTRSPSDWELYMKGHIEVPNCCPADGATDDPSRSGGEELPPDGMIEKPGEKVPAPRPMPNQAGGRRNNRQSPSNANAAAPASTAGRQNGPPGFIGPVGYDVVK